MIPVIDLKAGQVVRAIAGRRDEYRPIRSQLVESSDPAHVASSFIKMFASDVAYVADLDAIQHQVFNATALQEIMATGLHVWVDVGLRDLDDWHTFLPITVRATSAISIVCGLETIQNLSALRDLLLLVDPAQTIFSLDLRNACPLAKNNWDQAPPEQIVADAYSLGIRRCIVLDLARVGVAGGTGTVDLCRALRQKFPDLELFAGGGVRGLADLRELHDAGCQGALVATALHDGGLTGADVALAARWKRPALPQRETHG